MKSLWHLGRIAVMAVVLTTSGWLTSTLQAEEPKKEDDRFQWRPLFDGKTLKNWKPTPFGGEGEVSVKDGAIHLSQGSDISGVTWTGGELPKTNFEIRVEAQRVEGSDFFCGLTFPVKESCCSLIVGGWGGAVVGLSSLDGVDAANNDTATYQEFKSKQWYRIVMRVTDTHMFAWIDEKQVVDVDITKRKIGVRGEMDVAKPLGIACYATIAEIRNFRVRELKPDEVKQVPPRKLPKEEAPAPKAP